MTGSIVFADRVLETTTTSGAIGVGASIVLAGAAGQYRTFAAGVGDGHACYFEVLAGNGTDWQTCRGTVTAATPAVSVDAILASSNGGAAITLSGTSKIFATMPGARLFDTLLSAPADGDRLRYSAAAGAWINGREPRVVAFSGAGTMTASQLLLAHKFSGSATLPANFGTTTAGEASGAEAMAAAAAQAVLTVQKCLAAADPTVAGNWSTIGTVTFAAGGHAGVFATTGGAAVTFASGDKLQILAPSTADATLASVFGSIAMDR